MVRFAMMVLICLLILASGSLVMANQSDQSNLLLLGESDCLKRLTLHQDEGTDVHLVEVVELEVRRIFSRLFRVRIRKVYDMHYLGPDNCGSMIIKRGHSIEEWRWEIR